MKRILVVLALLALCSMGFSVSGKVYGRLVPSNWGYGAQSNDGSTWYASENWWGIPLDDLRVGRQGTGVSVNFDSFTLDYKLRAPLTSGYGLDIVSMVVGAAPTVYVNAAGSINYKGGGGLDVNGKPLKATSPGYFQISGLKFGSVDLAIGASWWTLGQGVTSFATNPAPAISTNADMNSSVGYNLFAIDVAYNIQIGDLSINAHPWNKADFYFWTGGAVKNDNHAGLTNNGSAGGFQMLVPVVIDYSMEAFSLEIYTKWAANISGYAANGVADVQTVSFDQSTTNDQGTMNGTNNSSTSMFNGGGVVKLGYVVNELVSIYAAIGFESDNQTVVSILSSGAGAMTNTHATSLMFMPIFGGVALAVSPALTFNLGLGYDIVLSGSDTVINATAGGATTNYNLTAGSRFQSEWDTYEMHAYYHPLIKFAANTKFAGDFSAGLVYAIMLNDPNGCGDNGGYLDQTKQDVYGHTTYSNWLNFVNIPDFDAYGGSCAYIGYAKDNYEVKGWFGNETQLAGLFSAIDFTIKY